MIVLFFLEIGKDKRLYEYKSYEQCYSSSYRSCLSDQEDSIKQYINTKKKW